MKRTLALILVLALLSPFAVASETEYTALPTEEILLSLDETDAAVFSRGAFTGETYREQLDGDFLQIYDAINDSALGTTTETDLAARVGLGFGTEWDATFTRDGGNIAVDEASMTALEEYCNEKVALILPALSGLLQDEVELSWLTNQTFSIQTPTKISVRWSGNQGTGKLILSDITFGLKVAESDTGVLADFEAGMEVAREELSDYGIEEVHSTYEMAEILHRYVCDTVEYASGDLSLRKYQTVYSAFEGITVCAGYAKFYKALCDEYGIPCILVQGESFDVGHMWNYVRMDDGVWYAVDTTWDDTRSGAVGTYFLKGQDVFSSEHSALLNWGEGYPYVYPSLSATAYTPEIAEGTCGADINWRYCEGVLTLSGTGNMDSYGASMPPWIDYQSKITALIVGEGITELGEFSMYGATALSYVSLPSTLTVVPYRMFDGCTALDSADFAGEDFSSVTVYPGNDVLIAALKKSGAIPLVAISTVNGAQIRTKGVMGLRFISTMEKNEDVTEYGMVLIPSADLTDISDLTIDAVLNGHQVAKVEAKYLYAEDENTVTFTAVITNIATKNYTRAYTVRAYAILNDGTVVYGETFTSRSVAAVASAALERDPNLSDSDRELFESIVNG